MDWAQVLVIILAVALAVFLVSAIVLVGLLIKISRQIKTITGSAERAASNIENTVTNVSRMTSPVYVVKLVTSFLKQSKSK